MYIHRENDRACNDSMEKAAEQSRKLKNKAGYTANKQSLVGGQGHFVSGQSFIVAGKGQ